MSRVKKLQADRSSVNGFSVHPKLFVFFDKKTGTRRFEVKADENGSMPTEQAVSLLAIHCVARQQMPKDFGVMVAVGEDLVDGIAGRATKLIRTCAGSKMPGLPLSRRQSEVLSAVAQNLSNKEIAAKLNVSVRTIKFHVSTLLEKFDVRGRVDLMLEAAEFLPFDSVHKRVGSAEPISLQAERSTPTLISPAAKFRVSAPLDRRAGR